MTGDLAEGVSYDCPHVDIRSDAVFEESVRTRWAFSPVFRAGLLGSPV